MGKEKLIDKLEALIRPVVEAMGCELWGLELGPQGLLRVYVDSEQGVGLDDLSRVSNQLSGLLDVEDPITQGIDPSSLGIRLGGEERARGVYKDINDSSNRRSQQRRKPKCDGYILEVSSPGLDRPLFTPEQYKKFIGQMVKIKVSSGEAHVRHNYLGKLESVTDDGVTIISDGEKVNILFNQIFKAHRVYQYE